MTKDRIEKLLKLCDQYDKEHIASYYLRECLEFIKSNFKFLSDCPDKVSVEKIKEILNKR
jgi:hypothetical protein